MDQHEKPRSKASTAAPPLPSNGAKLNDRLIAERVTTLLSHYWTAAEDERLRALQISDWLDDLGEFPAAAVADSCAMWRRTESRRPTPSDIRKLCLEVRPTRPALPAPQSNHRPPDHVIREDFMLLPVRDWTRAELAKANADLDVKAAACGMTRLDFAKAQLGARGYPPAIAKPEAA